MAEINPNIIYPNGWIVLYKDVELDNTYQHTFFFSNESDRESIFDAGGSNHYPIVATFDNMLYQHVKNENKIRVQIDNMKVSNISIYSVNYMRFKNNSYENKWFYAFVTDITYINDKVCELTYELDVMTTFYFDYHLGTSFVEREHSSTDYWEDCLVPESLEIGEYNFNAEQQLKKPQFYWDTTSAQIPPPQGISLVLIANDTFVPHTSSDPDVDFKYKYGLPSSIIVKSMQYATRVGNSYRYCTSDDLQDFYDDNIKPYVDGGKTGALLGLFLLPDWFVGVEGVSDEDARDRALYVDLLDYFYDGKSMYTPWNKKLLTFPYKFVYVRDVAGNACVYKYEFSVNNSQDNNHGLSFAYCANISAVPSSLIAPLSYKGVNGTEDEPDNNRNFDEAMTFSSYPQLSLVTDAYKQWLAENGTLTSLNGVKGVIGGISQAVGGVAAMGLGSPLTAAGGAVSITTGLASAYLSTAITMAKFKQAEIQPNQSLTSGTAAILNVFDVCDYLMGVKEITPAMARSIDDFFTMYGYACHKCKIPSRKSRAYWTYTKTLGCVLTGDVPNSYLKKIASIFDNGITFWVTSQKNQIGNYYQSDNRINAPEGQFG